MSVDLMELSVAGIHALYLARSLSSVELVSFYLGRIEAYDKRGPALNAIITVNPHALDEATARDARISGEPMRPLEGIPVILKDNYDTADMVTTGGSLAFAQARPRRDAFVVERLRAAGAIILAKTNLTELARGGTTVSSLGGQTKNPYDLTRTPGGSSGGSGAAIAANFAVLGTGSDTGQSTRSPSSANALVGIRGTRGLLSRRGIMPLSTTQDEPGPIARSVTDAALMLEVMAGYDPEDPITAFSLGRRPRSYAADLQTGLSGVRIGLLTDYMGRGAVHEPVNDVAKSTTAELERVGATVVPVSMPGLEEMTADIAVTTFEFKKAFKSYLQGVKGTSEVVDLPSFLAAGQFYPPLRAALETDNDSDDSDTNPEYMRRLLLREKVRQLVMTTLARNGLDVLLYPHQRRLVALIGEEQLERNGVLSNATGFPAVTFPGGFSLPTDSAPIGVPIGMEVLGPDWSEPLLLKIAYAFEQATLIRKPPLSVPPL